VCLPARELLGYRHVYCEEYSLLNLNLCSLDQVLKCGFLHVLQNEIWKSGHEVSGLSSVVSP
jgi:hypothetical protein